MDGAQPPAESADAASGVARVLGSWALPVGLLVLLGPIAPLDWGLVWPLLGTLAMVALGHRRWRLVGRWVEHRGGWSAALSELGLLRRSALLALVAVPSIVLLTVAARAVGSIVVMTPASIWALPVLALGAVVIALARGRARLPATLVVAVLVPAAGAWGARFEAAAEDARGWAHSGPIHGIHPFQTTAIVIDGYGPFDLPINDYVEPDGSRGYGPEELADAIERALHDIAAMHFDEGPHRARMAFAGAKVEARRDPAIVEKLDEPPTETEHPRFFVQSGTWGPRSRVEFVCPGRVETPGPAPRENVMNKMCPDKYASEASAGLGVTGRWAGYAEGRGNERIGVSKLAGWTRSDDARGRRTVEREIRIWAFIVLAAVGMWSLLGWRRSSEAAEPRRLSATAAVATAGGTTALLAVLAFVVLVAGVGPPRVAAFERPPAWVDAWVLQPWLAMAMLGGALSWFDGVERPTRSSGGRMGIYGAALALVVAVVVVSARLDALAWVRPQLWVGEGGGVPLEGWVISVADAVGPRAGLDILAVESAVSAVFVAVLVGACAALGLALRSAVAWTGPVASRNRLRPLLVVLAIGAAAALVVSRKTLGAATLLPGAITLSLLLGSTLTLLARSPGSDPAARARLPIGLAVLVHLGFVALAIAGVLASAAAAPALHPFVLQSAAVGLLVALGSLAFLPWRTAERGVESGGTARDA